MNKKTWSVIEYNKNSITFFPEHYTHVGAFLFLIFLKPKKAKTIFEAKHKNMISIAS